MLRFPLEEVKYGRAARRLRRFRAGSNSLLPHGFPSESSINRMLIVRRSSVIKDKGRGIDASASDSDRILMALGWPEKDYGLGTSKSLQIFVPETR